MIRNEQKGFTLIEILIVVAIIAILASVVLVGLGPTQQSGRDARRLGDLHNTQTGLELYYNRCGYYPGTTPAAAVGACPSPQVANNTWAGMSATLTAVNTNLSIRAIPNDPSAGKSYQYGTTAGGTSYIIEATLENANNSILSTYTAPSTAGYTGITTCAAPSYCLTL